MSSPNLRRPQKLQALHISTQKPASSVHPASPPLQNKRIQYQFFEPPSLFQTLSYLLIRPPKLRYDTLLLELSPEQRYHYTHTVHDVHFPLSLYIPRGKTEYVVLYLHGNSSNRLEGALMLRQLPEGVGLACFDFEGCGNRNGDWITLGIKESKEVDVAARYLKKLGYKVVGWGRSMGAVSLLMSEQLDIMVADSPFESIKRLGREFGKTVPYVPYCLYACLFPAIFCCIDSDIQKKIDSQFSSRLEVCKKVASTSPHKCIMFLCATGDTMIDCDHSKQLFKSFKGNNKDIIQFEGTHNSPRSKSVIARAVEFIQKSIKTTDCCKDTETALNGQLVQNLNLNSNQLGEVINLLKQQEEVKSSAKQSYSRKPNYQISAEGDFQRQMASTYLAGHKEETSNVQISPLTQ